MLVAFLATSAQAAKHLTVQARPLSELVTATTGPVQPGAGNIDPTITWGGDADSYIAEMRGIYAKHSLKMTIRHNDDVVDQTSRVLRGEQVYFRGTLEMGLFADEALRKQGLHLVPALVKTTSTGGDCMIVGPNVKNLNDVKKLALQYPGPHVYYAFKLFKDAGRPIGSPAGPQVVYYPDLTYPPTGDSGTDIKNPVAAFRDDTNIDATMCITADSSMIVGAEGRAGARVYTTTKVGSQIIYDLVFVRSDYFETNRNDVERFVAAHLEAGEYVSLLYNDRNSRTNEFIQLSAAMDKDFGMGPEISGGMIGDCTFTFHEGNYRFVTGDGTTRNLDVITSEMMTLFKPAGLIRTSWTMARPVWDWVKLAQGLRYTASAGSVASSPKPPKKQTTANETDIEKMLASIVLEPTSDADAQGRLFTREIFFDPGEETFDISKYSRQFREIAELLQTYPNATVSFTGFADPRGLLENEERFANHPAKAQFLSRVRQGAKTLTELRGNKAKEGFLQYCRSASLIIERPENFFTNGVGYDRPKHPITQSMTAQQRAENRRVMVEVFDLRIE